MKCRVVLRLLLLFALLGGVNVLPVPQAHAQGGLSYNLPPNFGMLELRSGFRPDPVEVFVLAGGDIYTSPLGYGNGCAGYTTEGPTFRLYWTGRSSRLRFVFDGVGDTTLLVNDPRARWYCNDDSYNSSSPTVDISSPSEGQYDIWVGSYSGDPVFGLLYISESDVRPGRMGNLITPSQNSISLNGGRPSGAPSQANFYSYAYGADGIDRRTSGYCSQPGPQIGQYAANDSVRNTRWVLSGFRSNETITLVSYQGGDWARMSFNRSTTISADNYGRAWVYPGISSQTAVVAYGNSSRCLVSWPPYVNGSFSF